MRFLTIVMLGLALGLTGCNPELKSPSSVSFADQQVSDAISLYEKGDLIQAATLLEGTAGKPLQIFRRWQVENYLGNCYADLDQLEKALECYERSLDDDPENHVTWVNKGVAFRKLGLMDDAEACYQKALSLEPDYAELHSSLGTLYLARDDAEQAIPCFQKALELNPGLAVTHGNYALALAMQGEFEMAQQQLDAAARLGYQNASVVQERIDSMRAYQAGESESPVSEEPSETQ